MFEALHAKVAWENDIRSVVATKSDLSLKLQVGSKR
ncbi:stalk domain-containing protein [Paenibacillus elgii]